MESSSPLEEEGRVLSVSIVEEPSSDDSSNSMRRGGPGLLAFLDGDLEDGMMMDVGFMANQCMWVEGLCLLWE